MIYTDDPIRDASIHYDELEKQLSRRALCGICGEHIQEEYCYNINGEYVCMDCLYREYCIETPVIE